MEGTTGRCSAYGHDGLERCDVAHLHGLQPRHNQVVAQLGRNETRPQCLRERRAISLMHDQLNLRQLQEQLHRSNIKCQSQCEHAA